MSPPDPPNTPNGWNEWGKYVLKELERQGECIDRLNTKIDRFIWASLTGLLGLAVSIVVVIIKD